MAVDFSDFGNKYIVKMKYLTLTEFQSFQTAVLKSNLF